MAADRSPMLGQSLLGKMHSFPGLVQSCGRKESQAYHNCSVASLAAVEIGLHGPFGLSARLHSDHHLGVLRRKTASPQQVVWVLAMEWVEMLARFEPSLLLLFLNLQETGASS